MIVLSNDWNISAATMNLTSNKCQISFMSSLLEIPFIYIKINVYMWLYAF